MQKNDDLGSAGKGRHTDAASMWNQHELCVLVCYTADENVDHSIFSTLLQF